MNMEERAKKLYEAIVIALPEIGFLKLLTAASDARARLPWEKVCPETRNVLLHLAAKLTEGAPKL
jgi:hypothetical protein